MQDAQTGISGLDEILGGGLTPGQLYLIEGVPGAGKTTLAMQCLLTGVAAGERTLYISLSETVPELQAAARSHGWNLDGVELFAMPVSSDVLNPEAQYTIFHPSEVELSESTKLIIELVERVRPSRVVLDSLSELRMMAGSALRYRRQILAFKQYFDARSCMLLLLDDLTGNVDDLQVQSIANGVIRLENMQTEFGSERRRLRILKMRARQFRGGYHDYAIRRGGLMVFPRLVASEHRRKRERARLRSGISQLDDLLGDGLEHGSATLIIGAAGTGKSSIAAQFATAAAASGEKAAMFIFDETDDMLLSRSEALGIDLAGSMERNLVSIKQIDPAEMSPGEFIWMLRESVENGTRVVVIDSLNGYLNSMPEERFLVAQLHELLTYLNQQGVVTILVSAQAGLVGGTMTSPVDASYLADAVVLLRYFEFKGEVRQAISIVKKRGGAHERTIREMRLTDAGIQVGEPLTRFRGVLSGMPTIEPIYVDNPASDAASVVVS